MIKGVVWNLRVLGLIELLLRELVSDCRSNDVGLEAEKWEAGAGQRRAQRSDLAADAAIAAEKKGKRGEGTY
jgi:hypothetical protein